jgi:hypothetical protein
VSCKKIIFSFCNISTKCSAISTTS